MMKLEPLSTILSCLCSWSIISLVSWWKYMNWSLAYKILRQILATCWLSGLNVPTWEPMDFVIMCGKWSPDLTFLKSPPPAGGFAVIGYRMSFFLSRERILTFASLAESSSSIFNPCIVTLTITLILKIENLDFIIPPATKLGGYTGITMSVRLSGRIWVSGA